MELNEIRLEIDRINREMQTLFEERMKLCGQVAQYKGAHGMEIFVPAREEAILDAVRRCGDDTPGKKAAAAALGIGVATLYRKLKEYEDEAAALSRTT